MRTLPQIPFTPVQPVVENLHGHKVTDPYRWLEDAESPETTAWVEEQNAFTRSLLDDFGGRPAIRERLTELLSIGIVTAPRVRKGRSFFMRRDGEQNQPVLVLREEGSQEERVLLDPNGASTEGTVSLDWWYPSPDGRFLAYGYSANGDEWSTLYVLDVDSGELLPDRIERARYASVAWLRDDSGFYYTRYPHSGEVPAGEEDYHERLFFHLLGDDPTSDSQIFVTELEPEHMIYTDISADGRYLTVVVHRTFYRSDVYLRDLTSSDPSFLPVVVGHDALFEAQIGQSAIYLHTNLDAPRWRLVRAPLDRLDPEQWEEVIPESADAVLESVTLAGGRIVAQYLRNATSSLAIYENDGTPVCWVDLPTLGTVTQVTGEWDEPEAFFTFESFTLPPTVYRLSPEGGESEVWASIDAPVRPEDYEVRQVWYTSADGTRVSMFLVYRGDLEPGHPHPTMLTGYGGFNLSRTPVFTRNIYLWLDHGGLYAVPNLRGGGEYGEEWHQAGMLDRKQNVFDDFIAAAEYLIEEGYTEPARLAISGGSNGGLLVGAALTQHPELFRAVACSVPLLDMLRYHHFLIARLWIPDYGSADDPCQFPFLYAYSPYHHVEEGTAYPAVLLMTADSDTRLDPLHARKMAARLQAATISDRPILLRVETRAGHGAGKPLTKLIDEQTDFWTFVFWQLGVSAVSTDQARERSR